MNTLPFYQVDAFTSQPFKGNPAAVCVLAQPLEASIMQSIAQENNLSETAFVYPLDKSQNLFQLRWFTPTVEVPLCGHATLATAKVLFSERGVKAEHIRFQTASGELQAHQNKEGSIELDFPADVPLALGEKKAQALALALGLDNYQKAVYGLKTKQIVIQVSREKAVRLLKPNFLALQAVSLPQLAGVAVTAKAKTCDFVSRFFDPWEGIPEDPVTGSVHTLLAPFWAEQLNKTKFIAFQASARGGELDLTLVQDRVSIAGQATVVLRGELTF